MFSDLAKNTKGFIQNIVSYPILKKQAVKCQNNTKGEVLSTGTGPCLTSPIISCQHFSVSFYKKR